MEWAKAGASTIVITGRAENLLLEVSKELQSVSAAIKIVAVRGEATSEEGVKLLWDKVKKDVGIIDVLICNAGVATENGLGHPPIGTLDPSVWWGDLVSIR
jgi:NAD(P)-dependent dehydrogenase (short-subunit alcohol dehydrogenase family)